MRFLRNRAVGITAAAFGLAALLGGSLGMAFAQTSTVPLFEGVNFVGGPTRESVDPEVFVSCLPDGSWEALYIWDNANQEWEHFYNTSKGVPGYVNQPAVGGIESIRPLGAVAILMDEDVPNGQLALSASQACE